MKPFIYAHRGFNAICPENTLPAFEKALASGCEGIELDVQLSSDGELVIIHDETVDRTTNGTGYVYKQSLSQLKELDAGVHERIPTLDEYFDLVEHKEIITNIELKNNIISYEGMEEKILNAVFKRRLENKVVFSSFRHDSIIKIKRLAPETFCGLLCIDAELSNEYLPRLINRLRDNNIQYLHPPIAALNLYVLEALLENHIGLNIWTVNHTRVIQRLANEPNVCGIITDNPTSAINAIKAINGYE